MNINETIEYCALCGCELHRDGDYAKPTVKGRSHATKHHYVPERFFGRSTNRRGTQREGIFEKCVWGLEGESEVFCYDCHEELIHNPVLLPDNIRKLREIFEAKGVNETTKTESRDKIAERIKLFQEAIAKGIEVIYDEVKDNAEK